MKYPDFTLNGAVGVLALTGYEGILGYRTNRKSPNQAAEIERCKPVVEALRKFGWGFASHSYGHIDLGKKGMTAGAVAEDTEHWMKEVGSLLGPTQAYITPFGAQSAPTGDIMGVLYKNGFHLICPVSDRTTVKQVPERHALYQTRLHVDGYGIRHNPELYKDFFDPTVVWEKEVRPKR